MNREQKIYIINQYYPPFMAATGQLLQELVEYLESNGWYVNMITGKNGNHELPDKEVTRNQTTYRLSNTTDCSKSMFKKLFSYITFLWSLNWFLLFKVETGSRIMVLSTPPMLCLLPLLYKKVKKFNIIYNIQDLYPEVLVASNPTLETKFWVKLLYWINQQILNKVDYIGLIGHSMLDKLQEKYQVQDDKVTIIENWALKDLEITQNEYSPCERKKTNNITLLYTGNLGRAHEIETILATMVELKDNPSIQFQFVGGGYNYMALKRKVSDKHLTNVIFTSFVSKEDLPKTISSADICLVIGKREMAGYILPSKFYGYISMGKPVIYVTGAEDDISEHIFKGKMGWIIPNRHHRRLSDLLIQCYLHPEYLNNFKKNVQCYRDQYLKRNFSLEKYNTFLLHVLETHQLSLKKVTV